MGKIKIGTLNGKAIVTGDYNLLNDNELYANTLKDGSIAVVDRVIPKGGGSGCSADGTIEKDTIAFFYNGTAIGAMSPIINLGTGECVYHNSSLGDSYTPVKSVKIENGVSYIEVDNAWRLGDTAAYISIVGMPWISKYKGENIFIAYGSTECSKEEYKTKEVSTSAKMLYSYYFGDYEAYLSGTADTNGVVVIEIYSVPLTQYSITDSDIPLHTFRIYIGNDA